MSMDRGEDEYPAKPRPSGLWGEFVAPRWVARLKLRWVLQSIDKLERELSREFGLAETAPMHAELASLLLERDALLTRLKGP